MTLPLDPRVEPGPLLDSTQIALSGLDSKLKGAVVALIRDYGVLPLSALDTDSTMAANSDSKVPSQKAVVTYVTSNCIIDSLDQSVGGLTGGEQATGNWTAGDGTWTSARNPVFTIPANDDDHSVSITTASLSSTKEYFFGFLPTFSSDWACQFTVTISGVTLPEPYNQAFTSYSGKVTDAMWGVVFSPASTGTVTITVTAKRINGGTGTLTLAPNYWGYYVSEIVPNADAVTIHDPVNPSYLMHLGSRQNGGSPNITLYDANSLSRVISGEANIAVGPQSLLFDISGFNNIAFGYEAMYANIAGGDNLAIGRQTLRDNINGDNNVALGAGVLWKNTSGFSNTGVGVGAMQVSISGHSNTGIGLGALGSLTVGSSNTAIGTWAGTTTTGSNNVAIGRSCGGSTTGSANVAIGAYAMETATSLSNAVAIGFAAMQSASGSTAGVAIGESSLNYATGQKNIGIGYYAGSGISTGEFNIAIGSQAGTGIAAGSSNVAIGPSAMYGAAGASSCVGIGPAALNAASGLGLIGIGSNCLAAATGNENVGIGFYAGNNIVTGINNILLGSRSGQGFGSAASSNIQITSGYRESQNASGSNNILIGMTDDAPSSVTSNWLSIGKLLQGTIEAAAQFGLLVVGKAVSVTSSTLKASALLQIESTTQGFLPPRMTTTQKTAISTPAEGLCVYDTDLHALCFYDGSAWKTVTSS